jgi:MYXO-CTERM domain-containing protein
MVAACGQSSAISVFERAGEPIVGGVQTTTISGVVPVMTTLPQGTLICTGVVLAPNIVIGGRTCLSAITGTSVTCPVTAFGGGFPPQSVRVGYGATLNANASIAASAVLFPPTNHVCGGDYAAIILSRDLTPDEAVPIPFRSTPIDMSESFTLVGYGSTGPTTADVGRRRLRPGLGVEYSGTSTVWEPLMDPSLEWMGTMTVACFSDDGAAALDRTGALIGLASRSTGVCDGLGVYERIDTMGAFLAQVRAHANADASVVSDAAVPDIALEADAAESPDLGAEPPDAALPTESPDASIADASTVHMSTPKSGCTCSGAPANASRGALGLMVLGAILLGRRKRRL